MSLSRISLWKIIKHQYQFKLRANLPLFNSLIIMQLIAILLTLGGVGSGSRGALDLNINYYSTDYVLVFTIIWAFILAIQITSKDYREQIFPFVTNNLAGNISNILFIFTASVVGAILAILSQFLYQAIVRFVFNYDLIFGTGMTMTFLELFMGIIATILFIFMFSSLGYLIGMLVQLRKLFIAIIPAFFIGLLIYFSRDGGFAGDNFLNDVFLFYFQEKVFLLFFLKVIITSGLIFTGAYFVSNRLEVR